MSNVNSIKIKNRLGDLMRQPGGRSLVDALRGAEQRVEKNSGEFLQALDRSIARLEAAAPDLTETFDAPVAVEIYQASNDMIAMAGLVGFSALDEVAHGLCDLLDVMRAEGSWSGAAIRVHIDAVLLLRGMDKTNKAAAEQVLDGLRRVWARFSVQIRPAEAGR